MSKVNEHYRTQNEQQPISVSFNATTGEIITTSDEALLNATKKQALRLLNRHDFVLINGKSTQS